MKILVSTKNMPRDEWLAWRRKGIGASDAPILFGVDPFHSEMHLFLDKLNLLPEDEQSEAAYWGQQLEPVIAKEFAAKTGFRIRRKWAILQHSEYPFVLANLDYVVLDGNDGRAVLECKSTSEYRKADWDDRIPDRVMIQIQHQMAVTGADRAYVAALIGGNKFWFTREPIARDDEVIANILKREAGFWELVESKTPPLADGSDACSDLLASLYNDPSDNTIPLGPKALDLVVARQEAKERLGTAEIDVRLAENRLKQMLRYNEVGVIGEWRVAWKAVTQQRNGKEITFRRFTITAKGGDDEWTT